MKIEESSPHKRSSIEVVSRSAEETQRIGAKIGGLCAGGDIFLLMGTLGTGKTTLTQGIARGLGIEDYVFSPSFVLVRELQGRLPLYHIDLYRLDNIEEIAELGLDDYLYGDGVCVVEWAEKGLPVFPDDYLLVELSYVSETERELRFKPRGERYREFMEKLRL